MKQLSIKDIAKLAGVVPSTVSFVINGKEKEMRISDEMSKRIRKIIQETGYIPNKSAASLRTGKTHIIGLIVEDISNNFFSSLAKSIEDRAYAEGYRLIYCSTENNDQKGGELIRMMHKQVDGFIITPTKGMKDDVIQLQRSGKPVVLIDRYFSDVDLPNVLVHNRQGIEMGVDKLIELKYKRIAFVITSLELKQMNDRLEAFKERASLHEVYHENLILTLPFSINQQDYEPKIRAFLKEHPEVDAVFFATNYLTIQGLKALQSLQWEIPNRVAVLSFDDHEIFELYTPSIAAINQPIKEIAQKGVQILTQLMAGDPKAAKITEVLLIPEMQIRNSI